VAVRVPTTCVVRFQVPPQRLWAAMPVAWVPTVSSWDYLPSFTPSRFARSASKRTTVSRSNNIPVSVLTCGSAPRLASARSHVTETPSVRAISESFKGRSLGVEVICLINGIHTSPLRRSYDGICAGVMSKRSGLRSWLCLYQLARSPCVYRKVDLLARARSNLAAAAQPFRGF